MNKTFKIVGSIIVVLAAFALVGVIVYARLANRTPEPVKAPSIEEQLRHIGENDDLGSQVFSMRLATTLETDVYHLKGNNVQIMVACRREGETTGASDYFTVELHRIDASFVDTLVGSATLRRWGGSTAVFEDTVEGDYYLRFVKDDDGQIVVSDAVQMNSYMIYTD